MYVEKKRLQTPDSAKSVLLTRLRIAESVTERGCPVQAELERLLGRLNEEDERLLEASEDRAMDLLNTHWAPPEALACRLRPPPAA